MRFWGIGETGKRGNGDITAVTAFVLCAALVLSNISCFSERDVTEPNVDAGDCRIPPGALGFNRTYVLVRNFAFLPDTVRVRAGGEVVWVNCETEVSDFHTSTSTTGVWNSGALNRGEFYARRFDAAGQFGYFCEPHPFMNGAVIVQ